MDEQEAIRRALAFLQRRTSIADEHTPVRVVYEASGDVHPFERWLVGFETHPGCAPAFTVVEIQYPSLKMRSLPLM